MRPRLAIGRITGLLIAVVALGVSAYSAHRFMCLKEEFYQWVEARPTEFAVDLSRPGEYVAPFRQTCSTSHGEVVLLELRPRLEPGRKPEEALRGLRARLVIKDGDGVEVETARIDPSTIHPWWDDEGVIVLARFQPFDEGEYTATVHVESGAPELAGWEQLVYARYQLCGCEYLPAGFACLFALAAGIVGLVAGAFTLPGLLRYGFRTSRPNGASENSQGC